MTWTPNTIKLKSRGRYEEVHAAADIYPGMLLGLNSSGYGVPHPASGGPVNPTMIVALENALKGGDITQKSAVSGEDGCPVTFAARGDMLLMLLQNGQNVANGAALMSAGDGTLTAAPGPEETIQLYKILAPSSGVTNTTAETTFSNGSYTLPASFLVAGDELRLRGRAVVSAQHSSDTHLVKVEFGAAAVIIATSGALALAATNYVEFDLLITFRTVGSSGTYVVSGTLEVNPGGTVATIPVSVAVATLDTTLSTTVIKVTTTASAADVGNVIALQEYEIDLIRTGGIGLIAYAQEAINNSGGTGTSAFNTAAFIRVLVP